MLYKKEFLYNEIKAINKKIGNQNGKYEIREL